MAFLKSILVKCQRCHRRATCEVFNNKNASHGPYCSLHGKQEVARLNREEFERVKSKGQFA